MSTVPSTLQWISEPEAIRRFVRDAQASGRTVGVVPTMGNLHEGHLSLVRAAKAECDVVVLTLFVNPTQFGPNEDFTRYPRTPDDDRQLCDKEGVDAIFAPEAAAMYPPGAVTRVRVPELDATLCGRSRPGHFEGVATIVAKLFNLVPADRAYFGEKDYQQVRIIKQMAVDLNFPIKIRTCPIVREADGLAMSSRNRYLTPDQRTQATSLYQALQQAQQLVSDGETRGDVIASEVRRIIETQPLAEVDYIQLADPKTLQPITSVDRTALLALAVRFGSTRLIDNCVLSAKEM